MFKITTCVGQRQTKTAVQLCAFGYFSDSFPKIHKSTDLILELHCLWTQKNKTHIIYSCEIFAVWSVNYFSELRSVFLFVCFLLFVFCSAGIDFDLLISSLIWVISEEILIIAD